MQRVAWLKDLRMADLERVGGKNASLGEMISALAAAGIRVPGGFVTTAQWPSLQRCSRWCEATSARLE